MFTGIIHHLGVFKGYGERRRALKVEAPAGFPEIGVGESIAVNGVCLSLTQRDRRILSFDLSGETLSLTNLGSLRPGEKLNLEPPLTLESMLSGHLVTGHVDGTGRVLSMKPTRSGRRVAISFPAHLGPYFVAKGSVAVNGVSLTVAAVGPPSFEVELIPLTVARSNLCDLRPGRVVNLECDILGKYVYNFLNRGKTGI